MASHDHHHHHHHHHSHGFVRVCPHSSRAAFSLSAHLTRRMIGAVLLRFQGRRWPSSGGFVGRGGRPRVALPRRPRAALPRAHLLPRRLHQARAAARLAHLHRARLHRRHWRPRRHRVSSVTSYCVLLLFLPIADSVDHIISVRLFGGGCEIVTAREKYICPAFVLKLFRNPSSNFVLIRYLGLSGNGGASNLWYLCR